MTDLSHRHDVERQVERRGDLRRDDDPTAGETDDDRVVQILRAEHLGEAPACVGPVAKPRRSVDDKPFRNHGTKPVRRGARAHP